MSPTVLALLCSILGAVLIVWLERKGRPKKVPGLLLYWLAWAFLFGGLLYLLIEFGENLRRLVRWFLSLSFRL